jgi:hypothetical protein
MGIAELLSKIHDLPRADKFRVLQFVTSELSAGEEPALVTDAEYPVWTPVGAEGAAAQLLDFLVRSNSQPA